MEIVNGALHREVVMRFIAETWTRTRRTEVLAVCGFASAVTPLVVLALLSVGLFTAAPTEPPPHSRTVASRVTRLYAADGAQLAALHAYERFIPVARAGIPSVVKQAVVAAEDHRFYAHRGVDFRSVFRALAVNVARGRSAQGASTITQQYVKHAFMPERERTLMTKLEEAALAVRLERTLSKEEILYRYLSTVYFGGGAYGVGAAADSFFRKPPGELTLSEAALLAGVLRAPSALNPRANPPAAEARRQLVLGLMRDQRRITDDAFQSAIGQRVVLAKDGIGVQDGVTLVYPRREGPGRYAYFVDYVRRYLVARYGEDRVLRGGLRVETSLDPVLQDLAEQAVESAVGGLDRPVSMSLVAVEPRTGLVRALVGGRDFSRSQVNLALGRCGVGGEPSPGEPFCVEGGGTGRQPGSAFKPFVLARALEEGMTLATRYRAPARYRFPSCRGAGCTVRNAGGGDYGRPTLRQAAAWSLNTVFAQLIEDVGVDDVAELAHRLGLTMIEPDGEEYGPSLALGAAEVSPLDMASAYAVFANRGLQAPASPILKVTTPDGEILEDNTGRRGRRVLASRVADGVTDALRAVVARGTGRAAAIDAVVAGKTGTAEAYSDAWFVGYTAELSTAVWMGYPDSRRPLVGINGNPRVSGGTVPARTWASFTQPALERVRAAPDLG